MNASLEPLYAADAKRRRGGIEGRKSTKKPFVKIMTNVLPPAPMNALQLEPLYAAEAKRRKQATQFGNTATQKSAEPISKGETRDKVAAIAGVSHDTIRKVKPPSPSLDRATWST